MLFTSKSKRNLFKDQNEILSVPTSNKLIAIWYFISSYLLNNIELELFYLTVPVSLKEDPECCSITYAATEHNTTIIAFLDVDNIHRVFFNPLRPEGRSRSFIFWKIKLKWTYSSVIKCYFCPRTGTIRLNVNALSQHQDSCCQLSETQNKTLLKKQDNRV